MKTTLRQVILIVVLPVLASVMFAEQTPSLFDQFNRIRSDEKAVIAFIRSLSKQEVFDLCNQYGVAVDCGKEGNEGMLIEVALSEAKAKGLSSADLLHCASTESASMHWRKLTLRYASGFAQFIDKQQVDSESVLRLCSSLLANPDVPSVLRDEACQAFARVLVDGYYIAVCGSAEKDKSRRDRVRTADTGACQAQDKKVAAFIDLALTLAEDEATPADVKADSIPKALRLIVRERGAKTPRLDQVRRFAEGETESDVLPKRLPYRNLLREINTIADDIEEMSK